MRAKRIVGLIILLGYLASNVLSYLGYLDWDKASASSDTMNTNTQLVALLVDEKIYPSIEADLKRYSTQYIQKHYPQSKALVLKINTSEYDAPEIAKLLENLYFDWLKDQSSRLIGLVLVGTIPFPAVRYDNYVFPSIYPYVDFLDQKYVWNQELGYFTENRKDGQPEVWHGVIDFDQDIDAYHKFFDKLKLYDAKPKKFVAKKIWYDDFIAHKKNFLEETYQLYQNKLLFAEDLIYHRYTDLFNRILQGDQYKEQALQLSWLAEDIESLVQDFAEHGSDTTDLQDSIANMNLWEINDSIKELEKNTQNITPTKLLERKIGSFLKDYHEIIGTPLMHTISENVKAGDRWTGNDSHYQKLQLKDQLLLGNTKLNGIIRSINDKLESFVDEKVEKEKYAMKSTIPYYYKESQIQKKAAFSKDFMYAYYDHTINNIYRFFYFGKDAQTVTKAVDYSTYRGTYRNLSGLVNYPSIIQDQQNPAKSDWDATDLTKKGLWSSYDVYSTQVDANRGFNMLNTEWEYELYQQEKRPAKYIIKCVKWLPWGSCLRWSREPKKKCQASGKNCETFTHFWDRIWGGASPINVDMDKYQNQIYAFSWEYDFRRATNEIFDIGGSVPLTGEEKEAPHFLAEKIYVSPILIADKDGFHWDKTMYDTWLIEKAWFFNVPLEGKRFIPLGTTGFSLIKKQKGKKDIGLTYKYRIVPSEVKHVSTTTKEIHGHTGLRYSEDAKERGYYMSIKDDLTFTDETGSLALMSWLNKLKDHLSSLQNSFKNAASSQSPGTIENLLSEEILKSTTALSSWQAELWSLFNDLIIRNYASDVQATMQSIVFRSIVRTRKIDIFSEWHADILKDFDKLIKFLIEKKAIASQIFKLYREVINQLDGIDGIISSEIAKNNKEEQQAVREAWLKLRSPFAKLSAIIHEINTDTEDSCICNHGIVWTCLWKKRKEIVGKSLGSSCGSSGEYGWDEKEGSLDIMIEALKESKEDFKEDFNSDPENPEILYTGMNILTPSRPIDSPRYLSFQWVGGNVVKLIYPDIMKVEVLDQASKAISSQSWALLELKSPESIRNALSQYLSNKVKEYNAIINAEKAKAKSMNKHYQYISVVDKLGTPLLDWWVRPYGNFTYEEFLEAIWGQKVLNSLAELLYFQNVSNQVKVYYDEIEKDLAGSRSDFDINERISYIMDNYLSQKRDAFYEEKNADPKFVIPSYASKGYEVWFINSDNDDGLTPYQDQIFDEFNQRIEPVPVLLPKDKEKAEQAVEVQNIQKECWFDINEGLDIYSFKTKKFEWREGLRCRLDQVKKKPFEIKLSFEGSLWAVPIKESISGDIIAPLADSRENYKGELKNTFSFHDIENPETVNKDKQVQEILNQTQITLQNKKINVSNRTWSINILSFKDYWNLTVRISSTGDNCLIINGQNTCVAKASLSKNPFKQGFDIPFQLGDTKTGKIVATLELCWKSGKCGISPVTVFAVPGPVHSFEIGLPNDRKILAGAYSLISLKAFDQFKNEIQRTLEPYTIEVDRGGLIVWWQERQVQEVNDFQNLTLLYRSQPQLGWTVKFSVKNQSWTLLKSDTATLVPWTLHVEQNGRRLSSLTFPLTPGSYFLSWTNGMEVNEKKAIPLDLVLRDNNGREVPITTNVILGAQEELLQFMVLKKSTDEKGKQWLNFSNTNSLFVEKGRAKVYLTSKNIAGNEEISSLIPWLEEQKIKVNIEPWPLAKMTFSLNSDKIDPNSTTKGKLFLMDERWNKLKKTTTVSLDKLGPVKVSPGAGNIAINNGELNLTFTSDHNYGLTKFLAEATVNDKKVQTTTSIITRKFFLENAINSGLNIMYLNLFWNDRWNQRWYASWHRKFSEDIIKKSEKTLAITTQLVDLNKIKKAGVILGKNSLIENNDNLDIQATQEAGQLSLIIAKIGRVRIMDSFQKIRVVSADPENKRLVQELKKDTGKSMYLYDLNDDFTYRKDKWAFYTKEGILIGSLNKDIVFELTNQPLLNFKVWNVVGKGQVLGKAIFTNLDYSNSTAVIEDETFEFWPILAHGSSNKTAKAIFSKLNTLKSTYQGYDSIQNSDEMEKNIGFRGEFKNVTLFAGGKTVGEATLPFWSEFLINIWDPLLKRIDQNANLDNADYNEGLGKVIYHNDEKPIFKVIDIDYNKDWLRDILVVYKDGTIRLQKQYQDKRFRDMETLMVSAEQIKDIFVGDVDGNKYEDIIIRNTKDQLRIYTNENWIFDVDGRLACLNTNVKLGEVSKTPRSLTGTHQIFVKDMDLDGKIDIATFDVRGYLKIFYGNWSKKSHSYLSNTGSTCDDERFKRQEKSTKIVKKFWLQLSNTPVKDRSIIRRDGLRYPTQEELSKKIEEKNNREIWVNLDPIVIWKLEDPDLCPPCVVTDYACSTNANWEKVCKSYKRKSAEPTCTQPADKQSDVCCAQKGEGSKEEKCKLSKWRLDKKTEQEIHRWDTDFDFTDMAQEGLRVFDKYVKNPFDKIISFDDGVKPSEQAFLTINQVDSKDPILWVTKYYQDLDGGNLENWDKVKVTVTISNKGAPFWAGGAFFDRIQWPWIIHQDPKTGAPENLKFIEGSATVHPQTKEYAYFLQDLQFAGQRIVYSYDLTYQMNDPLFKIRLEDAEITDYSAPPKIKRTAPKDGENADKLPDFIVQSVDGCNKKESILFNNKSDAKRSYRESVIDLQELSDVYSKAIEENKTRTMDKAKSDIQDSKTVEKMNAIPWIEDIQEHYSNKDILNEFWKAMKEDSSVSVELFSDETSEIEKTVQDIADKACNGFSFGLSNVGSCEVPVPFNQAFLAPGKYHLMWCIPLEPLTKSLWKGLPVFHFPGTLYTPIWSLPIPWGLKSPSDWFLWLGWGTYPSMIRIYVAPTLTAQLGFAICFWPHTIGKNLPSPFADIWGNCIVMSMPLPCGKNQKKDSSWNTVKKPNDKVETYHPWAGDYQETNTCELKKQDSPFITVASAPVNSSSPSSIPEGSYLGWFVDISYDSITSEADSDQNGIFFEGVKILGVKDVNNKVLWGKQQGIKAKFVGWFDRQIQYWINNLLRFRVEFIFPDLEYLSKQLSTLNPQEIWKLIWGTGQEGKQNIDKFLNNIKDSKKISWLAKNTWSSLQSKEQLTALDIADGDNPFEKLQSFFNSKELVNIRTQKIHVKIPWIYSEDIEAYKNYLLTWMETNGEVLKAWEWIIEKSISSCQRQQQGNWSKKADCSKLQTAKTQILQIQTKLDKTSEQIYQNIQTLELYKRFPLEIYEWLHVSDRYLTEISSLISKFFGYINYWMDVNANRFSQYVDAIITIIAVVKTYQVMVDLFVDRGKKCGKCTQDSYDQYSCKLSMLCPNLPIIPIPNVKIPSLYVDLSHLNLGLDIVLPRFNFVPESIELPRLPNLPEPPRLGLNINVDFNIPDIPQLPEPPNLPELPSFIPQVKMELPILPPAPKIPELPNKIQKIVSIAKKISKIYCIIKSWIGLVGENSVKARIEQMTQRTYEVPRVDNLDLTRLFNQQPLQWIDIEASTYVNLQYNFDAFYALMKGIVNNVNQKTNNLVSQGQEVSDALSTASDTATNTLNSATSSPIQVNVGYQKQLKDSLKEVQAILSPHQEKEKLDSIIALASTDGEVKKDSDWLKKIQNQISDLIRNEREDLANLSMLAKSDYSTFLKTLEGASKKEPLQLTFSSSLLAENKGAEDAIAGINPTEMIIHTEGERLQGYLSALKSHSAESLNMSSENYNRSKSYLEEVQSALNQRKSIKQKTYAGNQPLLTKNGTETNRTLLTQASQWRPTTFETASTDLSSYINGILVKDHSNNMVNVVHSKVNYERFFDYYQKDINNDKKPEVITRDEFNVYVKYADDVEPKMKQQFTKYYVLTPNLKNKNKKYESFGGTLFWGGESVKLYDQNWEVKNFRLDGQTFDTISFSWDNNKTEDIAWYLVRFSERVDGLLEKNDLKNVKYALFLPNETPLDHLKLKVDDISFSVKSQIGKLINEVQYYNPANDVFQFQLHQLPRKWQYLQVTTLKKQATLYEQNSPRSNQVVGWTQVICDSEPPKPKVELIRIKKPVVEDEGFDLKGFIGSYYDLQVTRTDNHMVRRAKIEENGKTLAQKDINAPSGTITLKNLFFTEAQVRNYVISAIDSQDNEKEEEVTLEINIPKITIEDIQRFSGWKEGIENPVLISSALERDIDKWDVSFERKRENRVSMLTAISNGQKTQVYPVTTYQTVVTGAYYDFWDLIGLYTTDKKLIATVNGHNGEIIVQPAYKKSVSLGVDFSKGYPVVKVVSDAKVLFEVVLKSEQLLSKEISDGTLFPLEWKDFGIFDGGEVVMKGKEPLLYIAPDGSLRSSKPLQWSYHFDSEHKVVTYTLSENAFWKPFATITFKAKSI